MARQPARSFSSRWMFISMAVFIGVELLIGGLIGEFLIGRYMSISLSFTLQGLLNLFSYFIGGILIGIISPGIRISEPALAAFMTVGLMLSLSLFTPYHFIQFSLTRWLLGGAIASFLAFAGAELGEKLTGNRVA